MQNLPSTEVLATLIKREEILTRLMESPEKRTELYKSVDKSRATVYRGLDQLEEYNLITENDGEYEPTIFGKAVYEEYSNINNLIYNFTKHRSICDTLYGCEVPPPVSLFSSSEFITTDEYASTRLFESAIDILDSCTSIKGCISDIPPQIITLILEQAQKRHIKGTLTVDKQLLKFVKSYQTEELNKAAEQGRLSIHEAYELPPFNFLISSEPRKRSVIIVPDVGGGIRGIIDTYDKISYIWLTEWYNERL